MKKKGHVLIVEDDLELLETIKSIITDLNYTPETAKNGAQGLKLIMAEPKKYSFVVSDIQMPEMNGIELFEKAKGIAKIPFVMMTGFSDLMDLDKAYRIGVTEFITKPFSRDDFVSCINLVEHEVGGQSNSPEESTFDYDYCRIHIAEFVSGSVSDFDLFLRLGENKFIRVAKPNAPLPRERFIAYQKKGLTYLYLKKEDFARYVGLSLKVTKAISQAGAQIPRHRKLSILKHSLEVLMQDSFINGMSKEKYSDAKGVVEGTMNIITESSDLFAMLEMLRQHQDKTYSQSLAVSLYAIAVAQKWNWTSPMTLNKIAMCGLFHDIGKKELPTELLVKPRIDLKAEEIKILESHTTRGQEILSRIPGIPEEVIKVAGQHHENLMGRGYPNGLNRSRIHPLAALIAAVNEFCELTLATPNERLEPKDALSRLFSLKKEELCPHTLKALHEIFDVDVPKELARIMPMKTVA